MNFTPDEWDTPLASAGGSPWDGAFYVDMAKAMATKTRIEPNAGFRMVRKAFSMDKSAILLEKHAIRTKTYVLFALENQVQSEILESFIKQVSAGKGDLRISKKFLV